MSRRAPMMAIAPNDGRRRAVIILMEPCIDSFMCPVKRVCGEQVIVTAKAFCDGHDQLRSVLCFRKLGRPDWQELPMTRVSEDSWRGSFRVVEVGYYEYTVSAWVDRFLSWRHSLARRTEAADIQVALQLGAELLRGAAMRAVPADAARLHGWAKSLQGAAQPATAIDIVTQPAADELMARYADRQCATWAPALRVWVDIEKAAFGAWYELFPRSCAQSCQHGTLSDCAAQLARIAALGFNVVYLPPIHPIGRTQRKGKNNNVAASADDPGSPWAIGAAEGGHKSVHPQLGTLDDFRNLMIAAKAVGVDIALDIALQCAPDHPYVSAHPEWFQWRPDNTVQYAENPPKKYQDLYPFDF